MGSFVQRKSDNGLTKVILPYAAIFYYFMWIFIALVITHFAKVIDLPMWVMFLSLVLMISLGAPYWSTIREVKREMKHTSIKISGSKYSFSNPLTYEWEMSSKDD